MTRYTLACARRACHTFATVTDAELDVYNLGTCTRCGWPLEIIGAERTLP